MKTAIEAQMAKTTELMQQLFGLGVKNVQTIIQANQKVAEDVVKEISSSGTMPDFTHVSKLYQDAGEHVQANFAEARSLMEAAFSSVKEQVASAVDQGIATLETSGHDVAAKAMRETVSQVQALQKQASTQAKELEKSFEAAQTEVKKQVKDAVSKVTVAAKKAAPRSK